jgi:hypothetical protein
MSKKADAQLIFKIEEIWLSYYNINFDSNIIDEDLGKGPYIYVQCLIVNNTDTSIVLKPSKSKSKIVFRYNKSDYELEVYPLPFSDYKEIILTPNDSIDLSFGSYLLLGTNVFNYKQSDYTKEMLSILPTLKVAYQDEKINIYTSEIKNVIIKQ